MHRFHTVETTIEHYEHLLNLPAPWRVGMVEECDATHEIHVTLVHAPNAQFACPCCGAVGVLYDHAPERTWRHLNVMQYQVVLRCALPRRDCPECGIKTIDAPWASKGAKFTFFFEDIAIQVIQACASVTKAQELLGLSWNGVQSIINRAVERGMARRGEETIEYVGIDEKSFLRGQNYISLMSDIEGNRVLEVVDGGNSQSVAKLWELLSTGQGSACLKNVKACAMDMGKSMIKGTRESAPHVAIVHDHFHVTKMLNDAVNKTRRKENVKMQKSGDKSLVGTRFLFGRNEIPDDQKEVFNRILTANGETAKAWKYKIQMEEFWRQKNRRTGALWLKHWLRSVGASSLNFMKHVGETLERHKEGLLNYFIHPISNAISEGFNSKIQAIKSAARGFRNFANYRARILFFCGKLNMSTHYCG